MHVNMKNITDINLFMKHIHILVAAHESVTVRLERTHSMHQVSNVYFMSLFFVSVFELCSLLWL